MNHSIIIYMLGWIMNIEAALMLIPILTAVVYKEGIISCYAGVAVVCAVLGFLCTRKKPKVRMFFAREGFVLVSLGWLVLSFFGCLPFVLSGEIPHFIDALFEIVSGFTTTGSSILPEPLYAVLAQLLPLDRRHGRSCIYPCYSSHGRRL